MKFSEIAQTFEAISQETSRIAITKILAQLLAKANAEEARMICYLALGSVGPVHESIQFNIADKTLAKVVADILQISPETLKEQTARVGDLGTFIKLSDWPATGSLTLEAVYNELSAIQKISGVGSQELRMEQVKKILESLDALSASYVVRIIVGQLRLGFSDMTLLDALSWMSVGDKSLHDRLEHAYNISADIGRLAYTLKKGGIEAVDDIAITVGIPIRPAAAERLTTSQAIIDKIGPCVLQPKLDGFRLQVHVDKRGSEPQVAFFSRNLKNMSEMFPEIYQAVISLKAETIIAEGEAIAYDVQTGSFVPFQETVKRKRKHGITQMAHELPLQLFMFDILYLDGESLLQEPYIARRKILAGLLHKRHDETLVLIEEQYVKTPEELEDYFVHALEEGLEGIIAKRPEAPYQPGKRNFNWIKLKRSVTGHLADTIDCVIVGYYYGRGKRAAFGIGAFLIAVYNKEKDRFETVAKVGTGLKDQEWRDLKQACDALQISEKPHELICSKELEPDVWVKLKIVCSVYADEITCSPLHTAGKTETSLGYALRFPRFVSYRPDKSPEQSTTVDELIALFKLQYAQAKKAPTC